MGFDELVLFITGPTYVRPEVKKAALLPEFGHRDIENTKRFKDIFDNLKKMWEAGPDYDVVAIPGSGSNAMETSIRSLVARDETVLNVSTGAFGDLYHEIAMRNLKPGMKAVQLKFNPGEAIDMARLEAALKEHNPQAVTLTHNETSTGVVNPIIEACQLVRKYGAMPLVDGVSIFGGAPSPIEKMGAGMYSVSMQKGMALPSGFGLAICSKEALEKSARIAASDKGYTTDLSEHAKSAKKSQILTTPNCSLANQLWFQASYIVNEEGIEARFQRHRQMQEMTLKFAEKNLPGFELFPEREYASPTVTCLKVPRHFTQEMLNSAKEKLRMRGYLMDPGYEKMNKSLAGQGKPLTIRIGHMGDITPSMLAAYLEALKDALTEQ